MPARPPRESGFTLLELLVVLAIIGIVAALLVSVARSAKESGQATECVSNLRQLAAANLAYAGEHNGQYCFAQDATNNTRWHGERSGTGSRFDGTREPRFLDLWILRASRCPRVPNHDRWRCNSYAP